MTSGRTLWQYWETRGRKPAFIDGLHEIARRNSGLRVVQVTPESLHVHLPDLPGEILKIEEIAHKADMIRTRLVARHGGMWLDSDAIVLRDLNWIFDLLEGLEFVGFNDGGKLCETRPWVRVNCFAAPANSPVIVRWVEAQAEKLHQQRFEWEEIGTCLIHPICLDRKENVKILPFEIISPVGWRDVSLFGSRWRTPRAIMDHVHIVMLSNKSLAERYPELQGMSVEQIIDANTYLSHFLKRALAPDYLPAPAWLLPFEKIARCLAR